jgi:hypothetical protein
MQVVKAAAAVAHGDPQQWQHCNQKLLHTIHVQHNAHCQWVAL